MINSFKPNSSAIPDEFITPASLIIQATTNTERIHLSGYCMSVSGVLMAISQTLEENGGSITHCTVQTDTLNRQLLMELQMPALSTLEVIRRAIHSADGMIQRLQIDYGIRPMMPASAEGSDQREQGNSRFNTLPKPCLGCRYYHGQHYGGHYLICAIHPYGPEEKECRDRQE